MASTEELKWQVRVDTEKLATIEQRLSGKFKSNPKPTAGVIACTKIDLDKARELSDSIELCCDEISKISQSEADQEKQIKLLDFAIDKADEARAVYGELAEKYENLRVKYKGTVKNESDASTAGSSSAGANYCDVDTPEFHGDVRKFSEFKYTFEALVHNNAKSDF